MPYDYDRPAMTSNSGIKGVMRPSRGLKRKWRGILAGVGALLLAGLLGYGTYTGYRQFLDSRLPRPVAPKTREGLQTFSVPHGTFTPFDIADLQVDSQATYWLCLREYVDAAKGAGMNYMASVDNAYGDGRLLKASGRTARPDHDLLFRIMSRSGPVPGMHRASEEELKRLPPLPQANRAWDDP